MKFHNLLSFLFLASAAAVIAIGRLYDERLSVFGINISIVISFFFIFSSILYIASIKKIKISKPKLNLFLFYLFLLIITPILWMTFGVIEFGLFKFFNFILITIPISIIVLEKLSYQEIKNLFFILIGLVLLLCFFAVTGLFETPRPDGRISILGGGPITFARWMGYGVLALIFLPLKRMYVLRLFFISLFIIYCLISGSRGPITILIFIGAFYFFLNFRKLFLRSILFISIIILGLFFTDVPKKISELGRTDRVFLNVSKRGGSSESTQTRFELADRSFNLTKKYPLGIGSGNWQTKANQYDPTHLMAHEYPHNLVFEIFNEYGIIAGLLFLLYIIQISIIGFAKMINNSKNSTSLYPFLFYLWIFLLLNAMLSGSLDDGRFLFIVSCCFLTNQNLILKNE